MFPRMRYKAIDVVGLMHCKMPLYLPVCQKLFSDTEYWDWLEMHCWKNARQLLEYFSKGNKKIFSLSTLELVVNKLENLVIFRNSLEGGTHVTTLKERIPSLPCHLSMSMVDEKGEC